MPEVIAIVLDYSIGAVIGAMVSLTIAWYLDI